MADKPKQEDMVFYSIKDKVEELEKAIDNSNKKPLSQQAIVKLHFYDTPGDTIPRTLTFEMDENGKISEAAKKAAVEDVKNLFASRDTNGDDKIQNTEMYFLSPVKPEHADKLIADAKKQIADSKIEVDQKKLAEVEKFIKDIPKDGQFSLAERQAVFDKLKDLGLTVNEGNGQKPNAVDPNKKPELEK